MLAGKDVSLGAIKKEASVKFDGGLFFGLSQGKDND